MQPGNLYLQQQWELAALSSQVNQIPLMVVFLQYLALSSHGHSCLEKFHWCEGLRITIGRLIRKFMAPPIYLEQVCLSEMRHSRKLEDFLLRFESLKI